MASKNQAQQVAKSSKDAQKQFFGNHQFVDDEAYYKFDNEKVNEFMSARPWAKDPLYFKKVKLSALALLKIVMHATKGGRLEVMGMLQGRVDGDSFIVIDTFALPVEGSETRVNAGNEAIEFSAQYADLSEQAGRQERVVGWYHSHPGYGCWLSGIDVNTQKQNQTFQDPWLAIVVDPVRTVASGKVTIGAFRTYPDNYKPENVSQAEYTSVPLDKVQDFGVYANQYYELKIDFFKSMADYNYLNLLWNKYWINTLSSSPMIVNRDYTNGQVADIASKLEKAENDLGKNAQFGKHHMLQTETKDKKKEETVIAKINKDNVKLGIEVLRGVISQLTKDALFNTKV